ncbi:acyl carrier protein [Candidatus Pelagibacter sp.]|nr:acyl carrier protein [Candidatus Pelagibacter sp.]
MKNKITKDEIYKIIGKILKTTPEKILKIDRFDKIKNWDSLAQLDILSAIDKKLGNKLNNLNDISSILSVKKLISTLKKKSLIK